MTGLYKNKGVTSCRPETLYPVASLNIFQKYKNLKQNVSFYMDFMLFSNILTIQEKSDLLTCGDIRGLKFQYVLSKKSQHNTYSGSIEEQEQMFNSRDRFAN